MSPLPTQSLMPSVRETHMSASWGVAAQHALKSLRRSPKFAIAAIAMISLSVGTSTAVFATMSDVVLKPLPFPTLSRLVELRTRKSAESQPDSRYLSRATVDDIRDEIDDFEAVAEYSRISLATSGVPSPQILSGLAVSGRYFDCLGVRPSQGRFLQPSDADGDGMPVAVVSYALWQRMFAGRPLTSDGGLEVTLAVQAANAFGPVSPNGRRYRVVGVTPERSAFPIQADIFVPLGDTAMRVTMGGSPRAARNVGVIALLKDPRKFGAVNSALNVVSRRLEAENPDTDGGWDIFARHQRSSASETYEVSLWLLFGAVNFVVVVATVSLSSLFLARSRERRVEGAIRQSLGATRRALVRQIVLESTLLAISGGLVGTVVAGVAIRLLALSAPPSLRAFDSVAFDWRVLGYSLFVSMVCGVGIAGIPMGQVSDRGIFGALRNRIDQGSWFGSSRPIQWKGLLISGQVALTVPLLVGSLLTAHTLMNLQKVDLGFTGGSVLVLDAKLSTVSCATKDGCFASIADLLVRLRSLRGVTAAAVTSTRPLSTAFTAPVTLADDPVPAEDTLVTFQTVSADFFAALGIPLRRGRSFNVGDDGRSPRVVIVNRSFARQRLGGAPIGRRLDLSRLGVTGPAEVVGEVDDTRDITTSREPMPQLYIPIGQARAVLRTVFLIRTTSRAELLVEPVTQQLRAVDPSAPIVELRTMSALRSEDTSGPRFQAVVLGFFGTVAVLLTGLGTFCLVSRAVTERLREMGIRIALGASRSQILGLIAREGLMAVVPGACLGALASFGVSRAMEHVVFQMSAYDPLTLVETVAIVGVAALAAHVGPAVRACTSDPMAVLRLD